MTRPAVTGHAVAGAAVAGAAVAQPGSTKMADEYAAAGGDSPRRAKFAVPDELTCYYDRPAEPANVHIEVRVRGRLDEAVLRDSVAAVLSAEERVRARRVAASRWRRSYYWEFPAVADADPVLAASWADETELARLRSEFLSQAPSLDSSPPLRFLLAAGPQGDCLILNAHHACFDGLSCLRLLRSVAKEYGAQAGWTVSTAVGPALPAVGPALPGHGPALPAHGPAQREPRAGARTPVRAARAGTPAPASAARPRIPPGTVTRISGAPEHGTPGPQPGYGAYLLSWDGLSAADLLRPLGCSVNDLLIAALMITIGEWNESHGSRAGRIRITMPVGERTQAGSDGRWANLSRLTSVTARVPARTEIGALLGDVARQTRHAKDHPGPQVDLLSRALAAAPIPVAVKHVCLRAALRVAGPLLCDTCLVSNLGVIEPLRFGTAEAADIWFSTSAHMPRGLSLGAVTAGGRLRLTFRYRRALFSDAAAAAFAGMYGEVLGLFAGAVSPS